MAPAGAGGLREQVEGWAHGGLDHLVLRAAVRPHWTNSTLAGLTEDLRGLGRWMERRIEAGQYFFLDNLPRPIGHGTRSAESRGLMDGLTVLANGGYRLVPLFVVPSAAAKDFKTLGDAQQGLRAGTSEVRTSLRPAGGDLRAMSLMETMMFDLGHRLSQKAKCDRRYAAYILRASARAVGRS